MNDINTMPTNGLHNIKKISGLWIGETFPEIAELCVRSFLDHGWQFQLFTYQDFPNIPQGTILRDASKIIPKKDIYVHNSGSLAPFSDWFRYKLLYEEGGFWTDMDVVCLTDEIPAPLPWFAFQEPGIAAIGVLGFPPGHPVVRDVMISCEDPSIILPWDSKEERINKENMCRSGTTPEERRKLKDWSFSGPDGFSRALAHYKILSSAAPVESVYPVYYTCWRYLYNGTYRLEDSQFSQPWAIHLWGEMLRREPDAWDYMDRKSVVRSLLERHGMKHTSRIKSPPEEKKKVDVLVGVCCSLVHPDRRQAVRDTWLTKSVPGVESLFFLGKWTPLENEPDVVNLDTGDGYYDLPAKVFAFFRYALDNYDFKWLFKCDDDTFVDLERLVSLTKEDADIIGNTTLSGRGLPSGGAGYLLSRDIVEKIVQDNSIPPIGYEDVLIGKKALELGARRLSTENLCYHSQCYPTKHNSLISAHWCSPDTMRAIHTIRYTNPDLVLPGIHENWCDDILFYRNGVFSRKSTYCKGLWEITDNGTLSLKWFDWPHSLLTLHDENYSSDEFTIYCSGKDILTTLKK